MKMRRIITLLLCLSFAVPAKPVTAQEEDYLVVFYDKCVKHGVLYVDHQGWHVIYCFNLDNNDVMYIYIPVTTTVAG